MATPILHAFGILIFVFAWLSFDHYRPWVNFHAEALAFFGIGLLALARLLELRHKKDLLLPRIAWVVAAVALLPWAQWLFRVSLFAGDALVVSLFLCGFAMAISLGYSYARDAANAQHDLTAIFYSIWFVALVSAAIGLLQWLGLQDSLGMYVVQTDPGDRAMGNMGQPNQLATLLLMGIGALAWTYERRRIGATGLICGVAFLSLVLVLTQSRTGIVSATVMALFLTWKNRYQPMRIRPLHALLWLGGFLLALQLLPLVHEWLLMDEGRNLSLTRDNGRLTIARQVLAGTLESPWFGYGWNQTPTAHAAGAIAVPGSLTYTNAHNVVLDILAWNGFPIGIAITIACAYWAFSRMRSAKDASALYAMAALLPIGVHSLFEYPFAYAYFLMSAGLFIGIVETSRPQKTYHAMPKWSFMAFIVSWFIVGVGVVREYLLIEEDFRIVRFENLRIGQTPEDYQAPENIWMLSQMESMLRAARQAARPNMSHQDLENLRKASQRFPYGALGLRYALALGLNGQPEAASRQMQIVHGMYGEGYYQAAVSTLRAMQKEHPDLRAVITP